MSGMFWALKAKQRNKNTITPERLQYKRTYKSQKLYLPEVNSLHVISRLQWSYWRKTSTLKTIFRLD
ncbi:hypothetical protein XENTR_v10021934 [Xenopus tropicalis]|nr:hypothetical protein XENTR_v10021934 [Xenopus tropicalis]